MFSRVLIFESYIIRASCRGISISHMWEAFFKEILLSYSSCRRVHITKTTLDYLDDKFEVEPGNGSAREQYLADHKVETYLIVPPKV